MNANHGPVKGAGRGGDARGYSWAPFEPGNVAALRDGARSPRVYGPLAQQLAAGLLAERPDLAAHPEAVASWATLEAQAALRRRALPIDAAAADSQLVWLLRLETAAAKARDRLGLDPRAEAALTRDRAASAALAGAAAVNLGQLAERGRQVLDARAVAVASTELDAVQLAFDAVQASALPPTTADPEESPHA